MLTFLLDHTLSFLLWLIEIFDAFLPNRFLEVKCISPSGRSSWQLFSESSIIKFVFACVYLKFQSWVYQNHCQLHQQNHLVCFFASKFILWYDQCLPSGLVYFAKLTFEVDLKSGLSSELMIDRFCDIRIIFISRTSGWSSLFNFANVNFFGDFGANMI